MRSQGAGGNLITSFVHGSLVVLSQGLMHAARYLFPACLKGSLVGGMRTTVEDVFLASCLADHLAPANIGLPPQPRRLRQFEVSKRKNRSLASTSKKGSEIAKSCSN